MMRHYFCMAFVACLLVLPPNTLSVSAVLPTAADLARALYAAVTPDAAVILRVPSAISAPLLPTLRRARRPYGALAHRWHRIDVASCS